MSMYLEDLLDFSEGGVHCRVVGYWAWHLGWVAEPIVDLLPPEPRIDYELPFLLEI